MVKIVFTFLIGLILLPNQVLAETVYQQPEDFIAQAFLGDTPKPNTLWLTKAQKQTVEDILQHRYSRLRVRYWQQQQQSVWILEEIGKEAPITVGLHIKDQRLQQVKVLIYRESRGDEVTQEFFTQQFIDAQLLNDNKLDRHIDGITGATLSVRALTKLSRMALWLDSQIGSVARLEK
ncbi:FMN-binding protein [Thalassotalea litorea]|uniref:FMN-binding protein n=1 Tax=Thalassotalea litorea TaxID=2020715 RepID=A0A5R9II62_9GAMM|nr:FMN-binding protein [Thalassotalea litorea]TLU65230.1 FMN-binding protein [Thalassotalea litorea]